MKFLGEYMSCTNAILDPVIDKVVLTVNNSRDPVILEYIQNDWFFECDKEYGDSCFSCYFLGISPQLIDIAGSRANKISQIKLVGHLSKYDSSSENRVRENFVWNIPCDMYVDDLEVSKDFDELATSWISLAGDVW